jgi:4'-phosphopantetheinyl transferase EntD
MAKPAARIPHARGDLFPPAFRIEDARFGTCVGVRLPVMQSADLAALLDTLHPEERRLCRAMRGARLVEWVGGRHASRLARAGMPGAGNPTLTAPSGAPEAQGGVKISISHTQTLAVALASMEHGYAIGVDVEAMPTDARGEELLGERILSTAERDGNAVATVQRLSVKEAVYKAVFTLTGKHLPLRAISVERDGDGGVRIHLQDAQMRVEAISMRVEGHYLSLARAGFAPHAVLA